MTSASAPAERRHGVFSAPYILPTIGTVAIAAVAAFQSLAMTTIMPEISRDLHGQALYSLSFAAPLAAGVPGMVIAGNWTDRAGARIVAWASSILFALGTAVVMLASSMPMFLIGRLVEGFGAGAVDVVLYVIVARLYPEYLHAPIFAGFAAAWVVPALVGPAIAGIVTDTWNWHWVFAGALAIAVLAFVLLLPSLGRLPVPEPENRPVWNRARIWWSVLAAAAVLVLNLAADLRAVAAVVAIVVGLVVTGIAVRPLLPAGAYRAAPGLATVVVLRGLIAAAFFGGEAYVPYLLQAHAGLSAGAAGIALTVAALSWAASSWVHGRLPDERVPATVAFRGGFTLVVVGLVSPMIVALAGFPAWIAVAGWFVGGIGMGFVYPRMSTLTLRFSGEHDNGFASSALTIADAVGGVLGLAVAGILFQWTGGATATVSFALVFVAMALIALCATAIAHRVGPVPAPRS
jgi:MFS family permease